MGRGKLYHKMITYGLMLTCFILLITYFTYNLNKKGKEKILIPIVSVNPTATSFFRYNQKFCAVHAKGSTIIHKVIVEPFGHKTSDYSLTKPSL